jgi:hypothetical protein
VPLATGLVVLPVVALALIKLAQGKSGG